MDVKRPNPSDWITRLTSRPQATPAPVVPPLDLFSYPRVEPGRIAGYLAWLSALAY